MPVRRTGNQWGGRELRAQTVVCMELSRQFYVSPCHESRLELEQATEENRPGAVNSNVIHSLSHDSRVWLFCPNIWFYAVQASAAHPNFHCDQNSEQLRTDRTNRPAGHDLSWKCRAAPETSLCHRHRHGQYMYGHCPRGGTHRSRWGCWGSGACCLVCSGWAASGGSGGGRVLGGRAGASGWGVAEGGAVDPLH